MSFDQPRYRRRHSGADSRPVGQPIGGNPKPGLGARRDRVVKADALDEAAIARIARIGSYDIEKRALLGAAACKSNNDHKRFLGFAGGRLEIRRRSGAKPVIVAASVVRRQAEFRHPMMPTQ